MTKQTGPKDQRGNPLAVVKPIDVTGPGSYRPAAAAPTGRPEKSSNGTPKGTRRWESIK